MGCSIKYIEYYLPDKVITNGDLLKENPSWDMPEIVKKTGVESRHVSAPGETALDLGYKASKKLIDANGIDKDDIGALIFCTQSSDYILPANADILHDKLDLKDNVWAFDINLACSGYIYGLALSGALLKAYDMDNILLVTADTYSKYIHPKDKSVRTLFGDGAAATLLKRSDPGIIDVNIGTFGKRYDKFIIPAGGLRQPRNDKTAEEVTDNSGNKRTQENIFMEGFSLLSLAMAKVPENIRQILAKNDLEIADIDLFVFHQASKAVLDALVKAAGIPEQRVFNNARNVGNVVSASIPIALKDALTANRIKRGDKVLLCGFGAGFSWGSVILEWG